MLRTTLLDSCGRMRGELVEIELGEHGSVLDQIAMQLETPCQVVAKVARTRSLDVTMEVVAVGRVGTPVDQPARAFRRTQAAQIGDSLLGDHEMHGALDVLPV